MKLAIVVLDIIAFMLYGVMMLLAALADACNHVEDAARWLHRRTRRRTWRRT